MISFELVLGEGWKVQYLGSLALPRKRSASLGERFRPSARTLKAPTAINLRD